MTSPGELRSEDVPEGGAVPFTFDGEALVAIRSNGVVHVFEDECSHEACPLSDGFVEDGELECECHGSVFDLETGRPMNPPAYDPLVRYDAREINGLIVVSGPAGQPEAGFGG